MAEPEIVTALAACLEELRQGEADLQACLERYPAHRAELEALLAVARLIPSLPISVAPSAAFRQRTRRWLRGGANGAPGSPAGWRWQPPSLR